MSGSLEQGSYLRFIFKTQFAPGGFLCPRAVCLDQYWETNSALSLDFKVWDSGTFPELFSYRCLSVTAPLSRVVHHSSLAPSVSQQSQDSSASYRYLRKIARAATGPCGPAGDWSYQLSLQAQEKLAGVGPRVAYLLMYPSPSPSHVWKSRRIRSSSPVLDVSLLPPLLSQALAAAIARPPWGGTAGPAQHTAAGSPEPARRQSMPSGRPGAPGDRFHLSGFCLGWEDGRPRGTCGARVALGIREPRVPTWTPEKAPGLLTDGSGRSGVFSWH